MAKPNQIKAKKKNPDAVKGVKKQSPQQKRSSKLSFSNALGRIRKKFEASKSKVNKQLKDLIQPLNTHILPNLANEDWSATGNGQVTYNLAALAKIRQETQRKASIKPRKTHDQLLQKYQEDLNQAVVRVVNMMDLSLLPGNEGENDDSSCVRLSTRMFNRRDVEIEYEKAVEAEKQLKIKREPANDVEVIELDTTVEEEIVCLGAVGKSPTNKEKSNKQNDNNTCMERSDSELKQPTFDPLMNSNGPTKSRQPLQSFKSWITQSEPLTTFKSWVTQSQSSSTDSRSSRTDTNGNKTTTSGPTTEMQSKPNHPQFTLFSKRKEVEIPKINLQYMTRTAPTASSSRLQNNPPSGAFFNKPSTATYSESAIKKTVSNVGVPTKKLVKSTSEHLTTPPIDPKNRFARTTFVSSRLQYAH
ncbi:hypothetical protein M3Y94_00421000 [Aphelenchoides besseyi]|nr:hypothetical protein M3Y94_00421000 [Aphelenchoides besseyi]